MRSCNHPSRRWLGLSIVLVAALALAACGPVSDIDTEPGLPERLVLASTTSLNDSGLFDVLIPAFEQAHPEHNVAIMAVGSGAALELGRTGDADVLFTHSPEAEQLFVSEGYGTERVAVMYNEFVVVGPEEDPALLGDAVGAADALAAILVSGETFVSRGNDSGTYRKEIALWEASGMEPGGETYVSAGPNAGMGATLALAHELQAYALSDRGTYLHMLDVLRLAVLFEGGADLVNQYSVIPVTDATNETGVQAFIDWVTGEEAQALIGEYGVDTFGEPLYVANADS